MHKLLVAALLIVTVGVGGYFAYTQVRNTSSAKTDMAATGNDSTETSLKTLLESKSEQVCTFTDIETTSSGTVYVGKGSFKGDFTSQVEDKTIVSHVIVDGTDAYVWMDGQTQGFKSSWDSIEEMSATAEFEESVDINRAVEYNCQAWNVDDAMFGVPTDITFTDYSEMVEDLGSMMEDNTAACAACSSLTGDSLVQCKVALKCK